MVILESAETGVFYGLLVKPSQYNLTVRAKMRISRYWFRTRSEKGSPKTNLSAEGRRGWVTRCRCDRCSNEFNRVFGLNDFSLCAGCRTADRGRTEEARNRASQTFGRYYSDSDNRDKHSAIAAERYRDDEYANIHKLACKLRSSQTAYRLKLSQHAARGKLHAIKTSCGKQGISLDEFEDFVTGKDIREREHCKTTVGRECLEKSGFTCVLCHKNGYVHAHHLDGWHWAVEKRFDIDNLVCLCRSCHSCFHSIYGFKNNTREQFEEFRLKIELRKV